MERNRSIEKPTAAFAFVVVCGSARQAGWFPRQRWGEGERMVPARVRVPGASEDKRGDGKGAGTNTYILVMTLGWKDNCSSSLD